MAHPNDISYTMRDTFGSNRVGVWPADDGRKAEFCRKESNKPHGGRTLEGEEDRPRAVGATSSARPAVRQALFVTAARPRARHRHRYSIGVDSHAATVSLPPPVHACIRRSFLGRQRIDRSIQGMQQGSEEGGTHLSPSRPFSAGPVSFLSVGDGQSERWSGAYGGTGNRRN